MPSLSTLFKPLTAARENRLYCARYVENHPESINELFELAHNTRYTREHIYAAWVWELYILKDLSRYWSFFDLSIQSLMKIENSSMRRAHSKTLWHFLKNKTNQNSLTKTQKEGVISICLDWIISEDKAAPLNFCIRTLLLFKKEFPEIQTHLSDLLLHSNRKFPVGIYPVIRSVFKN